MERGESGEKNWLEKMREDQDKDPREIAMKEMMRSIVEIK